MIPWKCDLAGGGSQEQGAASEACLVPGALNEETEEERGNEPLTLLSPPDAQGTINCELQSATLH